MAFMNCISNLNIIIIFNLNSNRNLRELNERSNLPKESSKMAPCSPKLSLEFYKSKTFLTLRKS